MSAWRLAAVLAVIGVMALLIIRVLFWIHPEWGGPPGGH
jgi:hypothetical protein